MVRKTQPYEKLVDYIKNNPHKGLTIPHTDIEKILGVPYRKSCGHLNTKYMYHVNKANSKLLTLNLALESISGFGYRILSDNQYANVMCKKVNTARKYILKAKEYGDSTDTSTLSKAELKVWKGVYDEVLNICNHMSSMPLPTAQVKSLKP